MEDNITLSTCFIFKEYEQPGIEADVNKVDYTIVESIWEKSALATKQDDVTPICQRIITAKVAYEEFMGR